MHWRADNKSELSQLQQQASLLSVWSCIRAQKTGAAELVSAAHSLQKSCPKLSRDPSDDDFPPLHDWLPKSQTKYYLLFPAKAVLTLLIKKDNNSDCCLSNAFLDALCVAFLELVYVCSAKIFQDCRLWDFMGSTPAVSLTAFYEFFRRLPLCSWSIISTAVATLKTRVFEGLRLLYPCASWASPCTCNLADFQAKDFSGIPTSKSKVKISGSQRQPWLLFQIL